MKNILAFILLWACAIGMRATAQNIDRIPYGDFNQWITREIKESGIIGGNLRKVYEIGPAQTIEGNKPYSNLGGSPWATSNVYAKVAGVSKTSNAVYPSQRSAGNYCAKLCSQIETLKVLGVMNLSVMVSGSIFLGEMLEPITSTSNPYGKMEMGIPYAKRPRCLSLDIKVDVPDTDCRTKATGFGSKKSIKGRDSGIIFVFLQRRWEDADGNLHAKRVGTGGKLFSESMDWTTGYEIPIKYGEITQLNKLFHFRQGDRAYYAKNSKGKMVPVEEEGWDQPDATPTHMILMISSGSGEAYEGTEGLTMYVDNIAFKF